MPLTAEQALRAYAAMLNTGTVEIFEPLLADDFVYELQTVIEPVRSKQAFLEYIRNKLVLVERTGATVFAEMGVVSAYGARQPCVIVAQKDRSNLVALALAKVADGKLTRIDLCVVPPPETAERSGEYPT